MINAIAAGMEEFFCDSCKQHFLWHCKPNYKLCKSCYDRMEKEDDVGIPWAFKYSSDEDRRDRLDHSDDN